MALITANKEQRINNMIRFLENNTPFSRLQSPGSKARYLLDVINQHFDSLVQTLDANLNSILLSTATGETLDLIGETFSGLRRREASIPDVRAFDRVFVLYTTENNFGSINNNKRIFIPRGTPIHDGNGDLSQRVVYLTSEDINLEPSEKSVYFSAAALNDDLRNNIGPNTLTFIDFSRYSESSRRALKVTNELPVDTATLRESDADYRYRISLSYLNKQKANESAIRLAALSVPGVSNISFNYFPQGVGTLELIIQSISPVTSQDLISRVQTEVDLVAAAGNYITTISPLYYGLEIWITLVFNLTPSPGTEAQVVSSANNALLNYINNLSLGESFNYNSMVNTILQSDSRIYDIGIPGKPIDRIYVHEPSKIFPTEKIKIEVDKFYEMPTAYCKFIAETSVTPVKISTRVK